MPLNRTLMEGWLSMEEEGDTGEVGRVMGWGLRAPASSSPRRSMRGGGGGEGGGGKREREREREEYDLRHNYLYMHIYVDVTMYSIIMYVASADLTDKAQVSMVDCLQHQSHWSVC